MALTDIIALDREAKGWIIKETAFATLTKPASANQVFIAGEVSPKQQLGFIEDQQRRNSYSAAKRFAGRYEPGTARIPIYIKPSGSLGTAPEANEFLEGAFGREVVTPSTKVDYLLQRTSDPLLSYSVWILQGHFMYMLIGSLVDKVTFPLKADNSNEALSQMIAELLFAELRWTGTDTANETIGGVADTTLTVNDARKFSVGGFIQKRDQSTGAVNDNSGAGFQVTAVNYSTNVLTISPGITNVNPGDYIEPWRPAATAEVGSPVHGRLGSATLAGVNLPIVGGEIALENNFKMLNEEKNGLDFANRAVRRSVRRVSVRADVYFDANAARFFYTAAKQVQGDFIFPWGTTAGSRFKLTAKNVEFDAPDVSGAEEKIITLNGQAFASSSLDDELAGLFD